MGNTQASCTDHPGSFSGSSVKPPIINFPLGKMFTSDSSSICELSINSKLLCSILVRKVFICCNDCQPHHFLLGIIDFMDATIVDIGNILAFCC